MISFDLRPFSIFTRSIPVFSAGQHISKKIIPRLYISTYEEEQISK